MFVLNDFDGRVGSAASDAVIIESKDNAHVDKDSQENLRTPRDTDGRQFRKIAH